jgi:hypothetical protein
MEVNNAYFLELAKQITKGTEIQGAYGTWVCDHGDATDPTGAVTLIWTLHNPEIEKKAGGSPYIRTNLKSGRLAMHFYLSDERRSGSSMGIDTRFTGDLDQDVVKYLEYFDSWLQIIEDPERIKFFAQFEPQEVEYRTEKPQQIPLSQLFKSKEEPVIPEEPPKPAEKKWRDATSEPEIIKLFPFRPKSDDILDLYAKAQQMKSNKLMNLARQSAGRVESILNRQAAQLVAKVTNRVREHCGTCASDVPRLKTMLAKQTNPKAKAHLQALLKKAQSAESVTEGRKKRVVLFKPCSECHQEEGKIDECQRCHGCGIDPEFVVRTFEDPRNYLNESKTCKLLDFADNGIQSTPGTYDPETLRQTIAYLMRTLGLGYEEARDLAMTHHDPRASGATEPMRSAQPEVPGQPPARTEKHCMRCGSRHHMTKDCHLGGIPI